MNMANIEIALEAIGKGMGGTFAAIIVIMPAVMVLGEVIGKKDKEEQIEDKKQKVEKWKAESRRQEEDMSPGSSTGDHVLLS